MAAPITEDVGQHFDKNQHESSKNRANKMTSSISSDLLDIKDSQPNLLVAAPLHSKPSKPGKTFKLPPSSVLSQVKMFLPQMEKANQDLENRLKTEPASAVNIEDVESDEQIIEMNIALTERGMDSSESDSDSETESVDLCPEVTTENFRTHKKSHINKQDTLITEISATDKNENNVT